MTDSDAQFCKLTELAELTELACPRCDHSLDAALHCSACKVTYPTVGGIPWLFAEPNAALAEWRSRFDFASKRAHEQANRCRARLKRGNLPAATRVRLEHLDRAYRAHIDELEALLTPIMTAPRASDIASHLALKTRLPASQGLLSYAPNLHRDWAWGEVENEASFECVANALGNVSDKRVAVLGAGGGRLAFDLHQRLKPLATIALDLNPLLLLVARSVTSGNTVTLTEFPLAPKRTAHSAITRTLAAPEPARPGFQLVLADARRAPFPPGSFDAIVTPWFIDIVDTPFAVTCARINTLLADGGTWVSFGSLAFSSPEVDQTLGFEEAADVVSNQGFDLIETSETDMPYMDCPESRHGRIESVVTFKAAKTKEAAAPARHEALPDWIVRGTAPVPATAAFKRQAATTRIYAFIMSMIDGKRSIRDMAQLMEEQRLMPQKEAESSLRSFLTKMLDESRSSEGL